MYSKILRNFIYPLAQMRFQPEERFISYLRLLEKTQWWTPIDLENFQQKKLQSLLKHAYENVPYYHKIFKKLKLKPQDIKNSTCLQKLPILTKEIIRNNLNDLIAQNYSKGKFIPYATGGSTGEPLSFFIDSQRYAQNMGAAYREWSWAEYNLGDKVAFLWGSPHDLSHRDEMKKKVSNFIQRKIMLDTYYMNEKTLDEYVRILRKFKPKIINAYASSVFLMALYIEKKGILDIRPKSILTSCEMLFDYQRKTIEKVFGCEVFDYYSGRDTALQAGECSEHSGYHLAIENAVTEFIKDSEHVSSGELGKIIITDLSNYAMPFIRYEIGDLGVPSDKKCPCGRGLPLMERVSGRMRDTIITKDGKYITGAFFMSLFYDDFGKTKGIKQFQFIQKAKDFMILNIVKGDDYSQNIFDDILRKIHEQCGDMKIEVKFVNSIPPTKSGKYRHSISEIELFM
jgi:phenylacetate-CoA ligase